MFMRSILAGVMCVFCSILWAHDSLKTTNTGQPTVGSARATVIPFADIPVFTLNGNSLQGLATSSRGVETHEVWRSSVAPGGSTPVHTHSSEEVFVILTGEGVVRVGDAVHPFKAPCTIVAPAGVEHQVTNTGDVASDSIVIVTAGSEIRNAQSQIMQLPWRQ